MATKTTNYQLNIAEPQTVLSVIEDLNPNFVEIDRVMKANETTASSADDRATANTARILTLEGTTADHTQAIERVASNEAPTYSDENTYVVGDRRIYNNILYRCISPVPTPEPFDSLKWERVRLSEELHTVEVSTTANTSAIASNTSAIQQNTIDISANTSAITQINADLSDISARVTANNMSVADIVDLQINVEYVAPYDGYVKAQVSGNDSYCYISVNNIGMLRATCKAHSQTDTIFVRKGMRIKLTDTYGTYYAQFIPIRN